MRASATVAWLAAASISAALVAMPFGAYAATTTVSIKDFAFQPSTVVVHAGDAVTWTNLDGSTHTATSIGTFDTGNMSYAATRTITFTTPGTYLYYCAFHSIMFGAVVVIPVDQPIPATPPTIAPGQLRGPASSPLITVGTDPVPTLGPGGGTPADEMGPSALAVASIALFVAGLGALAWRLSQLSRPG